MRKPLTLSSIILLAFSAFLFQAPMNSCTKTKTVTDTVTKTVTDTFTKTVTDTIPTVALQNGLVAYYPLNGNALDSSGNNHNGSTFGNLQYTTDENNIAGAAALFDGSSSYILVNDNGAFSSPAMTVSAQFYENSTAHQNLLVKTDFADAGALSVVWGIEQYGGTGGASVNPYAAGFFIKGPGVSCGSSDPITVDELVFTGDTVKLNTWYQITCTFENGVEKIYLNGVLKSALTFEFSQPKQCTQAQLVIGAFYQGAPFYFNGKMDKIRLYNRALNYREVQALATGL